MKNPETNVASFATYGLLVNSTMQVQVCLIQRIDASRLMYSRVV